jgi:hypothetical protein
LFGRKEENQENKKLVFVIKQVIPALENENSRVRPGS